MPKLQFINTNFTAGEFSPKLRGRVDIEKYNSSAELLQNVVVLRQGGATVRPSRDYIGNAKSNTDAPRLVSFVYSRTDAYILELGNFYMRVWKNGLLVQVLGVPYEIATPWSAAQVLTLTYTQGGDTIIVAHPDIPTQRIQRFADDSWTCAAVPFNPAANDDMDDTPAATCTPTASTPIGAPQTLQLDTAGFVATDVGCFVEINGGLVQITAYVTATMVTGIIKRELTGIVAAPPDAWVIRRPVWSATNGYPSTCTLYQQRLWLGGSRKYPQSIWGSKSGLFFDFTAGIDDDSAVYKTIDSDETNIIQNLANAGQLVAMSYGGEFNVRGGVERPITQLNASIKMHSRWGSSAVRPLHVGGSMLFVPRNGKTIRRLRVNEYENLETLDISVFAEHIVAGGVKSMSYEQNPQQLVWTVTNDGKLSAMTYNEEQNTVAFASAEHQGAVLCVATVPNGDEDATYCMTRYVINGVPKIYMERINWYAPPAQDCRAEAFSETAQTEFSGFGHLEGMTVSVLGDGIYRGEFVVSGGIITLPTTANTLSVGLPYSAKMRLQIPEVGTGTGTAQGQATSVNKTTIRFYNTIGCKVNGQELSFSSLDTPVFEPLQPFSGIKDVTGIGWDNGESATEIVQDQPYPWTVLYVVRTLTVNAG